MIHPWGYDYRKYRQEKLVCHGIDDGAIRELTFRLGEVIQKVRSCIDHFDLHVCNGILFTDVCQFIKRHLKITETNACTLCRKRGSPSTSRSSSASLNANSASHRKRTVMDMTAFTPRCGRVPFRIQDARFHENVRQRWMYCDGGCSDLFAWEKFSFSGCYLYKDYCPTPPKEWLAKEGNSKNLWQWNHWNDGRWDATWLGVNGLIMHHNKSMAVDIPQMRSRSTMGCVDG